MACIARIRCLGGRFVTMGSSATWSPDGKRLACSKTDPGRPYFPVLAMIDPGTGQTVKLASAGRDPAWSPGDGKFIAFVKGQYTREEIWLVESAGGSPRRIVAGGLPAWSPDGKTLFFRDRQKHKLMSVDPFAENPAARVEELLDLPDDYPAIDPARKQVAWAIGDEHVAVVNWQDGKTLRAWPVAAAARGKLGFSPDGKEIVACIADTQSGSGLALWLLNVESGRGVRVAEGPISAAAWSPDGSKLAFDVRLSSRQEIAEAWEIWMLDAGALAGLPVRDLPRDRYALPEGGVAELMQFISELSSFQPRNSAEASRYKLRYHPALLAAAEKVLRLENDKTSEAYQTAARFCVQGRLRVAARGSVQQPRETFVIWTEIIAATDAQEFTLRDYFLGSALARALEQEEQNELAAEVYRTLASRAANSADAIVSGKVPTLEGALRRLSLLGKSLDLTGTRLDGSPFDWAAYRGQTVLVYFWSSGAPEIASELAFVRKNLGLYGSGQRGFDVVGVNLDDNRQQVDRFLEREPQPWVNLFADGAGFRHPAAVHCGVTAVPTMILVGKGGHVVSIRARGVELDRLLEKLLGPAFQPRGKLAFIDLQPKANLALSQDIPFSNVFDNLGELLPGEQDLAGIGFNIGPKMVFLSGWRLGRPSPGQVEGIAVNRAFCRLYLLHAAAWSDSPPGIRGRFLPGEDAFPSGVPDGTLIGRYVLHYEHGVQETIPVIWGEDVRNWRSAEGGKPLKRGKVIWTGSNPMFRGSQETANLYLTVWENSHPEKRVITLDYVGTTPVAPFCVAITAEEPVSGETRPTRK